MGSVIHAYRHHPFHHPGPLSQELVGGWLGVTQAQLSRIEHGGAIRDLDKLVHWAQILRIPARHLWFDLPRERRGVSLPNGSWDKAVGPERPLLMTEWTPESAASLMEMVALDDAVEITPALAIRLAHEWLVSESPQVIEVRAGRQIGAGLIRTVERRVEQLRRMDDFIGGNDLYELVEKELRATTYLLQEASYGETLGKRLLTTVGELCQLAGWTAADAGLSSAAQRYYAGGIHAAHAAEDVPLAANLISLMSYLYSNVGNPREAVLLAHTAYAGAKHRSSATTQALLQERIAWAHARAGDLRQTERALGEADLAYGQRNASDDPAWVYWLNRDEMDVMAGRCYTELRQPKQAEPLLRRVLDHYNEGFTRETLLYSSWLAESYVQTEDIDEAVMQATRALVLSTRVNSSRGKERVQLLQQRLGLYPHVKSVREFERMCRELGEE
ncbi:MAG: helix-turn-helix domain-containing protein [Actinomycetota bacterium]